MLPLFPKRKIPAFRLGFTYGPKCAGRFALAYLNLLAGFAEGHFLFGEGQVEDAVGIGRFNLV